MVLPSQYSTLKTLDEFLNFVLKAYPDVETIVDKIVDGQSNEYKGFHHFSVLDHVTTIHVRQHGKIWQINRSSNIRNTAGYERYVKALWDVEELQYDERIVTYKCFIDEWLPWQTIRT